jgi:hypothetical protein
MALIACVSEKREYGEATLIQDPIKVKSIACDDTLFIKQWKAIKLELTEKSLIGEISRLEITEELIFVLDKKTVSLMVFDHSGKYLRSIGERGTGPGEYSAINAFYLDSSNQTINLFDPLKLSVHRYDFNGVFITSVPFKDLVLAHIARATLLNNGRLFCFTNPNWYSEAGYFILNEEDYSRREQIYKYPVPIGSERSFTILDHPYAYYNGELHFVTLFSNAVQSHTDGKNSILYYVDNGRSEDDAYLKSLAKGVEEDYFKIILKIADDNKYTPGLKNIFETDRYICVDFYEKSLLTHAVLWDKKENTGYYIDEYLGYTPNFGGIVYSFGNTLVKIWKNSDVHFLKSNLKKGKITNKYPPDFLELLDRYEEEDNPILLLYTLQNR